VQISTSAGTPITVRGDLANGLGPLASEILSGTGGGPGKSAERIHALAESSKAVTGRKGLSGLDSPAHRVGRANSYRATREARKTNQQVHATVNGVSAVGARQDAQPPQFVAVLGDVQDSQAGVAKAQATAGYVLSQPPGTALGVSGAAPATKVTDPAGPVTNDGKPAPAGTDTTTLAGGSQQDATQQAPMRTIDALLQTDQAVASEVANDSNRSTTPSDVAFATRITSRNTEPQGIGPNDTQAAIAAARFEGLALTGEPQTAQRNEDALDRSQQPAGQAVISAASFAGAAAKGGAGKVQDNRDAAGRNQTASTSRTAQPAAEPGALPPQEELIAVGASQFEAMASDSGSGESQGHAEANAGGVTNSASTQSAKVDQNGQAAQTFGPAPQPAAPAPSAAQSPAQPAASAAVSVQTAVGRTKTAETGQTGSSPSAGPQNASTSLVAAAPASIEAANGRDSANTKATQQEHTPQNGEAQNEPAERAGEAVRDISLNLSTKDQNVQVRLSERAGELHVTVRTPDATLSHGMREGLSDLVGRLERGGYRAETWQPSGSESRDRGHESPSRRDFSQQQNAGGKGGGRQQNSHDPESERETPKWIGELESSLHKE
jgi:hypothetical protein